MADPITLAVVGSLALTEGVKFLYAQASKILERRTARKDAADKPEAEGKKTEAVNVQLPEVFKGQLSAPQIDFDEVERLHKPMLELRSRLANYGDGMLTPDPANEDLIRDVDELRQILESIYGQRITFKDEKREESGTKVTTKFTVGSVRGKVTVTQIEDLEGGTVETTADIGDIEQTGEVVVTNIGKMKSGKR